MTPNRRSGKMAPATMDRVGAYGTHPKEEWWTHEALVIDYVNTFRRSGRPRPAGLTAGPWSGAEAFSKARQRVVWRSPHAAERIEVGARPLALRQGGS